MMWCSVRVPYTASYADRVILKVPYNAKKKTLYQCLLPIISVPSLLVTNPDMRIVHPFESVC